ncbi:uncharacterized protein C2orf78-like [Balaenoptera acutorostrata]|uniref:Uncharacterized protein C2orf78-like n=1 Tax=Balaenoptera acutorostrata TaxID=9767 RepID=A0ABM3T8X8_BALAC|nr:uncharacterized protein C2orf78-like [Balaenoptera acutorostrata]
MGMGLKEIQPTNIRPPASTSAIGHPVSAQRITETSFQVMETSPLMKNSLGLQPPSQTAFLWTDRELVKMKHQSAGEREEENDGNRFWETIFTLCFVCSCMWDLRSPARD